MLAHLNIFKIIKRISHIKNHNKNTIKTYLNTRNPDLNTLKAYQPLQTHLNTH